MYKKILFFVLFFSTAFLSFESTAGKLKDLKGFFWGENTATPAPKIHAASAYLPSQSQGIKMDEDEIDNDIFVTVNVNTESPSPIALSQECRLLNRRIIKRIAIVIGLIVGGVSLEEWIRYATLFSSLGDPNPITPRNGTR